MTGAERQRRYRERLKAAGAIVPAPTLAAKTTRNPGAVHGYPSARRPPGPITFKRGLDHFHAFAAGWLARDVCMP